MTAQLAQGRDLAVAGRQALEQLSWQFDWRCEKWDQDKVEFVLGRMEHDGRLENGMVLHNLSGRELWLPRSEGCPSDFLREYGMDPDEITVVEGNLLVNEGIQLLIDLLIGSSSNTYNNANSFCGVGDTATAEAATQTELLATQNAANRFYKGMVASYPQRPGSNGAQSADWRSDFTSGEANFVWNEWTIARGATTASGSGFLVGTVNLNRKVQSLGTKTTGTWTLTGTVTVS
jgi:hypothetical protein